MFAGGEAAKPTVANGSATGEYDVTFDRPVTIAQSQLDAVGTYAGTDGAQASIVLVRTPTPELTNTCISVSAPAPYTKLDGITTVSGTAQLWRGR